MATKAEEFKAAAEQANHDRKVEHEPERTTRNGSVSDDGSVARKAIYAQETHAEGTRPSRKSSRRSANRAKPASSMTVREKAAIASPASRHDRAR